MILYLYFLLLWGLICLIDRVTERRRKEVPIEEDKWDWVYQQINRPIEVTFDHVTFLVYDRDKEEWNLIVRVSKDEWFHADISRLGRIPYQSKIICNEDEGQK